MTYEYSLGISARWHGRKKPIFLAQWYELVNGNEEFEAFHTLAEAKRWCLEACDRKRGQWNVLSDDSGREYYWTMMVSVKDA